MLPLILLHFLKRWKSILLRRNLRVSLKIRIFFSSGAWERGKSPGPATRSHASRWRRRGPRRPPPGGQPRLRQGDPSQGKDFKWFFPCIFLQIWGILVNNYGLFHDLGKDFKEFFSDFFASIGNSEGIATFFSYFWQGFQRVFRLIFASIRDFEGLTTFFSQFWQGFQRVFSDLFSQVFGDSEGITTFFSLGETLRSPQQPGGPGRPTRESR